MEVTLNRQGLSARHEMRSCCHDSFSVCRGEREGVEEGEEKSGRSEGRGGIDGEKGRERGHSTHVALPPVVTAH